MIGLNFVTSAAFSRMRSPTHLDSVYPNPVTVAGDGVSFSNAGPGDVPSLVSRW